MSEDLSPYLDNVRHAAGTVWHSYGSVLRECMDFDDLYHQGVVTMMEVSKRYRANRGTKFWSYAEHRVRGAMLDHIFGDPAIPAKRKNRGHAVMRFDPLPGDSGDDERWWEKEPWIEQRPSDPLLLKTLFSRLDQRELRIIYLRFYKDVPLHEVGRKVGLTEGRVCQLINKIIPKLRDGFSEPKVQGEIKTLRGCQKPGPKKPNTWTFRQASMVKRMHNNGKSFTEIGKLLKKPRTTVHRMYQRDTTHMPSRPGTFHRITISKLVFQEIQRRGTMGESVDAVLRRLLKLEVIQKEAG